MGWKNWDINLTLLEYQGKWYQTSDDMRQGYTVMQYFNVVIEVTGNEFNVIKDRYNGQTSNQNPFADLFRVQLFTLGKTLYDLPKFTKSPSGRGELKYKDNGDLYEEQFEVRNDL
jgi:hypothetical protein